jgi:DNA-binding beta-propeller fold protein YncE
MTDRVKVISSKIFTPRMINLLSRFTVVVAFLLTTAVGCGDLEEERSSIANMVPGNDSWSFPYYLVIGGGLSETLSVLAVEDDQQFSLINDVASTGISINQTLYRDGFFYAVNSLSHSVWIYEPYTLGLQKEVSLGIGNNPMAMTFVDDRQVFVSNFLTNAVTRYDLQTGELLATIALPQNPTLPQDSATEQTFARPSGIAYYDNRVYCALGNMIEQYIAGGPGMLAVIDTETNRLLQTVELSGRNTVALHIDEANEMLYTVSAGDYDSSGAGFVGNGKIEQFALSTLQKVDEINIDGSPLEIEVSPEGIAYIGNGREGVVLCLDLNLMQPCPTIDLRGTGDGPQLSYISALALDGNANLYAAEFNRDRLFVIDTSNNNEVVATFDVNDGPETLTFLIE